MSTTSAGLAVAVGVAAFSLLATVPSAAPGSHPLAGAGAGESPGAGAAKSDSGSPPGDVAFVDTALPPLTAGMDKQVTIPVFVRNSTNADVEVSPVIVLRSASGVAIVPAAVTAEAGGRKAGAPAGCGGAPPTCSVPKTSPAFLLTLTVALPELALEHYPLSGWLLLNPKLSAVPSASKALEIKAIMAPTTEADWTLLTNALTEALLGVGLAGLIVLVSKGGPAVLGNRMGRPSWSFGDSWSSTLTIGGAILTPLLGFAGLPDQGHTFSKRAYGNLALLMAALIVLAPGVYNLFRTPVQTKSDATTSSIQYQGIVALFLVAALFTLTGVLAQLALLGALFADVAVAGLLSPAAAALFQGLTAALQIVLWLYAVASIVGTVHAQSASKTEAEGTAPAPPLRAGMALDPAVANGMKHPLPDWPLL